MDLGRFLATFGSFGRFLSDFGLANYHFSVKCGHFKYKIPTKTITVSRPNDSKEGYQYGI